jgi:hypothetical protein
MNVEGERLVESAKLGDGWLLWMDADVEGSYFFVLFLLLHVFVCLQIKYVWWLQFNGAASLSWFMWWNGFVVVFQKFLVEDWMNAFWRALKGRWWGQSSSMDWGCVSRICVEHNGRNVHCVIYEGLYYSFLLNLFVA